MKTTMKKTVGKIFALVLAVCMIMAMAVPTAATSHNQSVEDAEKGVVQIQMWFVDNDIGFNEYLSWGTGFFINEDTLVTCAHVVDYKANPDLAAAWAKYINSVLGANYYTPATVMEKIELRVSILRDVYVTASVRTMSTEMDYAVLSLDEALNTYNPLPLRATAGVNPLKKTETVSALGFPGDMEGWLDQSYHDSDDVVITSGTVNQVGVLSWRYSDGTTHYNVEGIASSAQISGGNSGGPLVDENGNVVGINAASSYEEGSNRYVAVAIDQVIVALDALGIDYTSADESVTPATEIPVTEAPIEVAPVETEAPTEVVPAETEAPTEAPTVAVTEPPVVIEEKEGLDPTILIVAAIAVVAVIAVVVVVMSKNKKKAAPAPAAHAAPAGNGGFNAAPHTPAYTAPMGAGETTVLSGDAGETTVLSRNINGGMLIRKRNGEAVNINAENFVIGRERKTANYCITDNTSIGRSHVTLKVRNGVTYLMDMNSTNGTFVNGVKTMARQEIALKNGDKVTLADEEFEYKI